MSSPDLTDLERQAVLDVFSTNYLSMGKKIGEFEEAFRTYTGRKYAIGVSSGTSGLHLCVRAAGIGTGDLVLTSPFSFVASTNVFLYENAVPVYVDVQPDTGNIDPVLARQAAHDLAQGGSAARRWLPRKMIGEGAPLKALLPIDVFGQPCDPLRRNIIYPGSKMPARHLDRSTVVLKPGFRVTWRYMLFTQTSRSQPGKAA
jgi:perosamine synthetase